MLLFVLILLFPVNNYATKKRSTVVYKAKYVTTKKYLGKYKITYYCPCSRCCGKYTKTASGTTPKVGRTISVDPKKIKLGSKVKIDKKTYIAEDTGGAIKGNRIDIFVNTHKEALRKGIKYKKVYLMQKKKIRVKVRK
ncbi:MAG: 3D domain-containing protein [Lachnospiraceae bacterium]|nr:3D domain-containing protein [Lachnospiraceae bacterium]